MKQLSGLDAVFLYTETPVSAGHVSSLSIYTRPDGDDGTYDPYRAMADQIRSRLPLLEPFRRRLVTVPLDLDHPYWIRDPDFDLEFHLRSAPVPAPGDEEALARQVARLVARPLNRSRPLWETYVMDGLPEGRFAVLTKVHHAAVDGAAGAELMSILLDHQPEGHAGVPDTDWNPEPVPNTVEMLGRTAWNLARQPGKLLRFQLAAVRELGRMTRNEGLQKMASVARDLIPRNRPTSATEKMPVLPTRPAPATRFNRSIGPHRIFAFRSGYLSDVKAFKNLVGCTVNDVVMAMVAGGLRRYLEGHGELPEEPLVTMIPVSIRTGDEADRWTNRVSAIFVPIPTDVPEPLERLRAVNASMVDAKELHDALPADLLTDMTRFSPPAVAAAAARLAARVHAADHVRAPVNLVISNVPGPREPLYLAGATLEHYYPVSIVTEGQGLNVTVQSYRNAMDFGLLACRDLVPDLWDLLDLIMEELDVLFEAIGEVRPGAAGAGPSEDHSPPPTGNGRRPDTSPSAPPIDEAEDLENKLREAEEAGLAAARAATAKPLSAKATRAARTAARRAALAAMGLDSTAVEPGGPS